MLKHQRVLLEIPRGDGNQNTRKLVMIAAFRRKCISILCHLVNSFLSPKFSVFIVVMRGRVIIRDILIMNKTIISGVISLIFSTSTNAKEPVTTPQVAEPSVIAKSTTQFSTPITTADVLVKANRFVRKDTETTYASEIHTEEEITASGAATLYDFLAQQTSLNVLSSFGNKLTPSINLRGFGNENGSQNVVITVDGQRLNNIDSASQLLGAIPLGNIERIEISKGSGSVIYGDGATAGAIQIYTKKKTGVTVSSSLGNYGQKNSFINAGISEQYIDLSASLAHDSFDGFSKKDVNGYRDESTSNTQNVKLAIKPIDGLRIFAEGTTSRNDIRFVNPLTRAQFRAEPRSVGPNYLGKLEITQQSLDTNQWKVGGEYQITDTLKLAVMHFQEDKTSAFPSFIAKYDYRGNDISLSYNNETLSAIVGYQDFDGDRKTTSNTTTKNNSAAFIQTEYRPTWLDEQLILSAGARQEKIHYEFSPNRGNNLKDQERLNAWDVGANYSFGDKLSGFVNYNNAFQAPDIDRFFGFDSAFNTVFNGFINPAKVKTLNLGLNHVTENNRLKATVFHANLENEIYLDPSFGFFGTNSNIDESHKYGLELQDFFKLSDTLSASVIYNFTRAIIDEEASLGGGSIRNKNLPGAPKHTVVSNINWKFYTNAMFNINHTWRSKAFGFNDFQNNALQRQQEYASTNIAINYQYQNLNIFATVNNIFEKRNSIQTRDNAMFPVDFERTWRVGLRADF